MNRIEKCCYMSLNVADTATYPFVYSPVLRCSAVIQVHQIISNECKVTWGTTAFYFFCPVVKWRVGLFHFMRTLPSSVEMCALCHSQHLIKGLTMLLSKRLFLFVCHTLISDSNIREDIS